MTFSSQHHSFDIALATEYGIEKAIIIHHLQHWIRFNRARKKNMRDGKCWMYQSRADMCGHFPYLTFDQIRRNLEALEEMGVIQTENYNRAKFDKTLWYAFTDEKKFGVDEESSKNLYERQNCLTRGETALREGEIATPIPDTIKEDTKEGTSNEVRKGVAKQPQNTQEKKKKYIDHVFLLEDEYKQLLNALGEAKTNDYIQRLDAYVGSRGKRYKSHYKTILSWVLNDKKDEQPKTTKTPPVTKEEINKRSELWRKIHQSKDL